MGQAKQPLPTWMAGRHVCHEAAVQHLQGSQEDVTDPVPFQMRCAQKTDTSLTLQPDAGFTSPIFQPNVVWNSKEFVSMLYPMH